MDLNIVTYGSIKELVEDLTSETYDGREDWVSLLEDEYPDSTFYIDEELDTHLDSLREGGFSEEDIKLRNKALYGNFIDIHYIKDDVYVMEVGVR